MCKCVSLFPPKMGTLIDLNWINFKVILTIMEQKGHYNTIQKYKIENKL